MLDTLVYYLLAFFVFIIFIGSVQKWNTLEQTKKDKIGLVVLGIFVVSLLSFLGLIFTKSSLLQGDNVVFIALLFFFMFVLFSVLTMHWYNSKYHKKVNVSRFVLLFCLASFGGIYLFLKNSGSDEKQQIVKNVYLKTTLKNITFEDRKKYFKDMQLTDGQILPMPEAMNNLVKIGDSIYKNKGDSFYVVINNKTKTKTKFAVKIHERVLGQAQ